MTSSRDIEKEINILILIGISKLLSEQSTFLIKEFSREKKQWFNTSINAIDNFVNLIENDLNEYNKKTLLILTESLNDGIQNLRKELLQTVQEN